MPYTHTPARILADGVNQMIRHGGPSDSIATLRGAFRFCSMADQEKAIEDSQPIAYVERVPVAAGQDE